MGWLKKENIQVDRERHQNRIGDSEKHALKIENLQKHIKERSQNRSPCL